MIRLPSIPPIVGKINTPNININQNIKTIFISIASYRDPDLVNTVRNAYENATFKDRLFFSIVSQADPQEHADLSFIPEEQIRYTKIPWEESQGACWAREIASRDIEKDYYLQIDSHSRFIPNWDKVVLENYVMCEKYWGSDIAFTMYPRGFKRNHDTGEEEFYDSGKTPLRGSMGWAEGESMPWPIWHDVEYFKYGHEAYMLSAGSLFCDSKIIKAIPYDYQLYFIGEEPTMALRFYTRGVKLINPSFHYMWHAYNDKERLDKRRLHWEDNPDWEIMNRYSYYRAANILTGDMSLGVYGIGSKDLYDEFQEKAGITLHDKRDHIIGAHKV
jgi:hypothetical protein